MIELGFQIVAVVTAAIAAWLWFDSTRVPVPNDLGVSRWGGKDALTADTPEKKWARDISEKNRRAALATAVSVGSQGAAILSSILI